MQNREILDSWKEIAAYLKRSRRTCQTWEKDLDLPIHRLDGTPKARVFAYTDELDRWLEEILKPKGLLQKPFLFIRTKKAAIVSGSLIAFALLLGTGILILQLLTQNETYIAQKIENSVAIISFKNQTGDKSYDYLQKAIPDLLITNLENSGNFYVATWERMNDLLNQMGKRDIQTIDSDIGFEICRREGVGVIVLGSIIKTGNIYAIDAKVLDVETKNLLKGVRSKGRGEESILETQIDVLSNQIYLALGMSAQQIEASQQKITDVTTTSMEAYNYFIRGREDSEKYYLSDARQFLEKSLQFDPTFSLAYRYLAEVYEELGDTMAKNDALQKAMTFSEKATEKERLYIEAEYASSIENNLGKAISILEKIAKKYPREKRVHYYLGLYNEVFNNNKAIEEFIKALELDPYYGWAINRIGYTYARMENFERALEYFKKYATVSPGDANPFDSMADVYFMMGRIDEAISKYKEAVKVKSDFFPAYQKIGYIYALKEDYTEALKWANHFIDIAPSQGIRGDGYLWKGFYHFWLGSFEKSLVDLQRAVALAKAVGNDEKEAFLEWIIGWVHYEKGDLKISEKYYKNLLDYHKEHFPAALSFYKAMNSFYLGLIDLKKGGIDSAKSKLTEMKSLLPNLELHLTNWQKYSYSLLYGEVMLAKGFPEEAIAVFENASSFIRVRLQYGNFVIDINIRSIKRDILARAYQQNGELDKAIAEYERLIAFDPTSKDRYLVHPRYHCRLAKLYEQQDDTAKAIEHYKKFLDLWKNADPGIAEVEDARERLAGLR